MPTNNLLPLHEQLYQEYIDAGCNTVAIAEAYNVDRRSVERKLKKGADKVGYVWPIPRVLDEAKAADAAWRNEIINPYLLRMEVKEFCYIYKYSVEDLAREAEVSYDILLNLFHDADVEVNRNKSHKIVGTIMRLEKKLKPQREWIYSGSLI